MTAVLSGFDICVVGSGPSSYALVSGLLRKNSSLRILVLEAGVGRFSESHLGERSSSLQPFKLSPTINIGYGGTSQLWHNVLAPLDESDFLASYLDERGDWPVTRQDLLFHYENIAKIFGFDFPILKPFFIYSSFHNINPLHFSQPQ